jgi:iron complex outermembrane receptor protein
MVFAASIVAAHAHATTTTPSIDDLNNLSIEQLGDIQVTSVTKTAEPIRQAPAAIYVITHDDITRSGATSVPEMLRLAPNLQVEQTSASKYVITARGLNGNSADQNFTNKLLVLIDGRSVYTPLYSGVYWDMQDVLPDNIDRIEVISGPGATLWGANAVNGVINIITRKAGETQGALVDIGGGNLQRSASLQYGGKIGGDISYRVYAKTFYDADTVTAANTNASDHWSKPQAGFRLDWTPSKADSFTVQGDGYQGPQAELGAPDEVITGADVSGRWNHAWQNGSALQVQAYWDRTARETQANGGSFRLDSYDLDVQHSFAIGQRNDFVWGGGVRISQFRIDGTSSLFFSPPNRALNLSNLFAQDTLAVTKTVHLILGLKVEQDPYAKAVLLPNVRLSWTPNDDFMLWTAASQAVRSPTPFDRDVIEKSGSTVLLMGDSTFKPERLSAFEAGARAQPFANVSFSASAYYNIYDDLKSIEFTPVTLFPLTWGNGIEGYTYGLEAWGEIKLTPWWRLSPGINLISEHLTFDKGDPGALIGILQVGDDPQTQASLKSSMDIAHNVALDADLRYASALPDPSLPAYTELNMRIGWTVTPRLVLSLSGFNLLHARHLELPGSEANAVPRSVFAEMRVRF